LNIRSLTRGDGAVIGAAVLLFVASFLNYYSVDCGDYCDKIDTSKIPSAWSLSDLGLVLPGIVLLGVIGAILVVVGRLLPEGRKLVGLTLAQWGTVLAVAAAWNTIWSLFSKPDAAVVGLGAWLALLATLVMAAAAVLTGQVPALKAGLLPEPKPQQPGQPGVYGQQPQGGYAYPGQQPGPYGAQPQPGYGYPGQQQPQPQPHAQAQPQPQPQPHGMGQPQPQPQPTQVQPQPQPATAGTPEQAFQPFWFAVPVNRPLYPEDGGSGPIAELAPGTWYLAVDQRGAQLVAQTQDGRRGVLQDTTGIQRG
jgi:hypothetical protein